MGFPFRNSFTNTREVRCMFGDQAPQPRHSRQRERKSLCNTPEVTGEEQSLSAALMQISGVPLHAGEVPVGGSCLKPRQHSFVTARGTHVFSHHWAIYPDVQSPWLDRCCTFLQVGQTSLTSNDSRNTKLIKKLK